MNAPHRPAPSEPTELRFDFDLYVRLGESRILGETRRFELADGRLIEMPTEGDLHMYVRQRLMLLFASALPALAARGLSFLTDPTVRIDSLNAVIPDLIVAPALHRSGGYTIEDLALAVEVAISSAEYDRTTKRDIYAQAGVPLYWLVEPEAGVVRVFFAPANGVYARAETFAPGQSLTLPFAPDVSLDPADFL